MDLFQTFSDLFLHLDDNLSIIFAQFGIWTYVLLFAIIFMETGLVVTPFLPGDSLLFVAGTLASRELLQVWPMYIVLLAGAIIGDTVNYWIGHFFGPKVFKKENSRIFNREYLEKTRRFYAKYGGKTIILARFIPIIRTFAPFVAGIGKMHYGQFISYNFIGGFTWVTVFTFGGYFFGNIPVVQENFHTVIIAIVILSVLPAVIEFIKSKREAKQTIAATTYQKLEDTFHKEHLSD